MERKDLTFKQYHQNALDWILDLFIIALVEISFLNYGLGLFLPAMILGVIFFSIVLGLLSLIIGFFLKKAMDIRFRLFLFRLILLVSATIAFVQTKAQVDLQISIRDHPSNYQNGKSL